MAQARLAARAKVPLDTVLRRYFAGYTLLGDFVLEEAERCGIGAGELQGSMRAQGALLERLMGAVAQEHEREVGRRPGTIEERKIELMRRLLDGESIDPGELRYDFDGWHLGIVASGPGAHGALLEFAQAAVWQTLVVQPDSSTVWMWIGTRQKGEAESLCRAVRRLPPDLAIGVGELADGSGGWRLTHRQALAASGIIRRRGKGIVHYVEVALLTNSASDDLLTTSLWQQYLQPLEADRDGGERARETLNAYFRSQRNVSSAAAMLGITRQAVNARLRGVERCLGRELSSCATELEVALRLRRLAEAPPLSTD
ncbi:MAG TPA: helix-turn-helix domain-containing protein [Solirubrobacterales bacterium]|nr:helix-turn-helix domain-containing protein [Solirubrobacterales bacterium]